MSAQQVGLEECMRCRRKVARLVVVTGDDVQREKPPSGLTRVCSDCLAKIRADARLESNYHAFRAVAELSLFVPSILVLLAATLFLVTTFVGRSIPASWHVPLFIGGLSLMMGVEAVFYGVRNRYSFTHNLSWSILDREVILGISMALAGALFTIIV